MISAYECATLPVALEKLRDICLENERAEVKTIIFCEDRLTLAAERAVCSAVGGTFSSSVYTFARFLASERGKNPAVLSEQGSAMAVRRIIDGNRGSLRLFRKLNAVAAAQSVYDTIALLYSSRVSAEDVKSALGKKFSGATADKLHDIALIYEKYGEYLEESGREDRNRYLKQLSGIIGTSGKIKNSRVVFLGFQALTRTVAECVKAAFAAAADVTGLFIGGKEDLYVNEALTDFRNAAAEFGGAQVFPECGKLNGSAERLRKGLYNPETFSSEPANCDDVFIFEAADEEEEFAYIAANIKKHVLDKGERYGAISVMLPDTGAGARTLQRVFSQYRIPYYCDRRMPLIEHPLCTFVFAYLNCAVYGCLPRDVDVVVAAPFFPADKKDKDIFRNYLLRLANYRGGVRRVPDREITLSAGFDPEAVERVRKKFDEGLAAVSPSAGKNAAQGIRALLSAFGAEEKLSSLAAEFGDDYPAASAFCERIYAGVSDVLDEAESLAGDLPQKEFISVLKSGFSACEISIIPPKADAVFVGDLAATANTGSSVVFAAGLTGDAPGASADTALLTDREINALADIGINVAPKILQVNMRRRETAALNVCAFREALYLSYPVRSGGEECGKSEIISYAEALFKSPSGGKLSPLNGRKLEKSAKAVPYYSCEPTPALKQLVKNRARPDAVAAIYEALSENGFSKEADAAVKLPPEKRLSGAKELYFSYNGVSPTSLETYFSCPYLAFMRQGLKVQERDEGAVRALDSGNFIHSVLQDIAAEMGAFEDAEGLEKRAAEIAEEKLSKPPYKALADRKSGQYAAANLKDEAVKVCKGAYLQLKNSSFAVSAVEAQCRINLPMGVNVFGRIDRVDVCGDMVRIIDYKTGTIDCSPSKYYTGSKLQLPLYLLAAAEGKRAVGAYYFPAAVEYREKQDGVFRLQGFMDGGEDVVRASDCNVKQGEKSEYFDAYLNGRKIESAMGGEEFAYFLGYSKLVAGKGAAEMMSGNIAPSPAGDVCKYCKMGGSCGFLIGRDGDERRTPSVKCSEIVAIAKENGGKVDD